ncbi:hypothetical protein [Elongatibacter sediminis]|uniref:Lipoprotein n=1 Tax=Elongatibacter sediminis TaxID=3119006 RepID=A0AAW9RC93_9GAMM
MEKPPESKGPGRLSPGLRRATRIMLASLLLTVACDGREPPAGDDDASLANERAPQQAGGFERTGVIDSPELDEISGLAVTGSEHYVVHNDDGPPRLYLLDSLGKLVRRLDLAPAENQDWEDLAVVPSASGSLLVVGDIGDNLKTRDSIQLYFTELPTPPESFTAAAGDEAGPLPVIHGLRLRYPDGAHDTESLAYEPASHRLILLTKRDQPPRLYGIGVNTALHTDEAVLEYLGELKTLRPPTPADLLLDPLRGAWISQPTALDFSRDGRTAAVLTYRSLYVFRREAEEDWASAFNRRPVEYTGPPDTHDEAVAFDGAGRIVVTTEGRPAPLYRLVLPEDSGAVRSAQSESRP